MKKKYYFTKQDLEQLVFQNDNGKWCHRCFLCQKGVEDPSKSHAMLATRKKANCWDCCCKLRYKGEKICGGGFYEKKKERKSKLVLGAVKEVNMGLVEFGGQIDTNLVKQHEIVKFQVVQCKKCHHLQSMPVLFLEKWRCIQCLEYNCSPEYALNSLI